MEGLFHCNRIIFGHEHRRIFVGQRDFIGQILANQHIIGYKVIYVTLFVHPNNLVLTHIPKCLNHLVFHFTRQMRTDIHINRTRIGMIQKSLHLQMATRKKGWSKQRKGEQKNEKTHISHMIRLRWMTPVDCCCCHCSFFAMFLKFLRFVDFEVQINTAKKSAQRRNQPNFAFEINCMGLILTWISAHSMSRSLLMLLLFLSKMFCCWFFTHPEMLSILCFSSCYFKLNK